MDKAWDIRTGSGRGLLSNKFSLLVNFSIRKAVIQNGSFQTKLANRVAVQIFRVVCLTNEFWRTGHDVISPFASFCQSRKKVAEKEDKILAVYLQ